MRLLDGKKVASELLETVKVRVSKLIKHGVQPFLTIIIVGENPASLSYVQQKKKKAQEVGILYQQIVYNETVTTTELVSKINELNRDSSIHGILVQMPLPSHIYAPEVIKAVYPKKDVDGFHAYNLGKMFLSHEFEGLVPCTPMGVIKLLEYYKIPIEGQEVVIVGRSNIVGKPMAVMFFNRDATVTVCHRHTRDLKKHTREGDVLVVAVGKPGFITSDMVKENAVVIDVGINRVDGKLVGDVDFEHVSEKARFITPVPGGVGPMTVACLMENVIKAAEDLTNHPDLVESPPWL